jgi:hypothetical protein
LRIIERGNRVGPVCNVHTQVVDTAALRLAYKYRSGVDTSMLERDIRSLRDATFYAAPREAFNDPFEGRFDRATLDSQFLLLKQLAAGLTPPAAPTLDAVSAAASEVLSFVDRGGVFSLSYNPLNELIWAHYGGSHRGFCIGYDLERLIDFEPNVHYCIDVQYSDRAPSLHAGQLLHEATPGSVLQSMLGVKSTPWQYEQEVRVITTPAGLHEHDYRALRRVYFGLRCPESTRLAVMEALAGRGVAYEQVESPGASYALGSRSIPDAYASAPKYRQNVAPIAAGAICADYLKPEQKQHQAYLYKAAEVVRREPYCSEVQVVEFSGSKSTPERPVIFVRYLRAPNKCVTRSLDLPEIDEQYSGLGLGEHGE